LFGWIWKRTRLANLVALLLTAASWTVLGYFFNTPGYCPLTDWHFDILYKLGERNLPTSYVKYLADRITGFNFDPALIDSLTLWSFVVALIVSLILNVHALQKYRKKKTQSIK
jgi:hypothetical protein